MKPPLAALALALAANPTASQSDAPSTSTRMLDLDGDGLLDRLRVDGGGAISVALNRGGRTFEPIVQDLPPVVVAEVLVGDLDRDGHPDLYLVSPRANVALVGDGTGRFTPATAELGLADEGAGRSAELVDVDADGIPDVLLHNGGADVLFWGEEAGGFQRDPAPAVTEMAPATPVGTLPPVEAEPAHEGTDSTDPVPSRGTTKRPGRYPVDVSPAGVDARRSVDAGSLHGGIEPTQYIPTCTLTIADASTGDCLRADSTPTTGRLYPLGPEFDVDANGDCFVGNDLHTSGDVISADDVMAGFGTSPAFRFRDGQTIGNAGLASPGSETLLLVTNATERMRITPDGNVGVGTSSPESSLHVEGADIGATAVQPSADTGIFVEDTDAVLTLASDNSGSVGSVLSMTEFLGGTFTDQWAMYRTTSTSSQPSELRFCYGPNANVFTNPTRLAIDDAGNVEVGGNLSIGSSVEFGSFGVDISSRIDIDSEVNIGPDQLTFAPLEVTTSVFGPAILATLTGSSGTNYPALYGIAIDTTAPYVGVRGQTNSPNGCGVQSLGDLNVVGGAKSFSQPHPTDCTKEIRFVCLEGNESGTYFRGSSRLESGRAVVEVPVEFRLVTEENGLTVQLTPVGGSVTLWIESRDLDRIVVRGASDVQFDYFVNGVRRGFADFELVRENVSYVPDQRGVPYGTAYPPALRQVLVENGILNPDFTPNEETARRNGWTLREAEEKEDAERAER